MRSSHSSRFISSLVSIPRQKMKCIYSAGGKHAVVARGSEPCDCLRSRQDSTILRRGKCCCSARRDSRKQCIAHNRAILAQRQKVKGPLRRKGDDHKTAPQDKAIVPESAHYSTTPPGVAREKSFLFLAPRNNIITVRYCNHPRGNSRRTTLF